MARPPQRSKTASDEPEHGGNGLVDWEYISTPKEFRLGIWIVGLVCFSRSPHPVGPSHPYGALACLPHSEMESLVSWLRFDSPAHLKFDLI